MTPRYEWVCTDPDCTDRSITPWTVSVANYELLRVHPPVCSCGTEKKRVIEPIALSPARETEGKA